jgi:hypothetical protein
MASRKQQRKSSGIAKKQRKPIVPGKHPDGDRRRRGGMTYEQGLAQKRLMQQPAPEASNNEEE